MKIKARALAIAAALLMLSGCSTEKDTQNDSFSESKINPSESIVQEANQDGSDAEQSKQENEKQEIASQIEDSDNSTTENDDPVIPEPEETEPESTSKNEPENTEIQTAEPAGNPSADSIPEQATQPTAVYGAIPFELAAGTEEWWGIDSTDSAYQACADNINAIRAEQGLPALTIDSELSAAADARCQSFVAGGPFDHSGMTTLSEICAKGPLGSAQEVCTAWKGSPAHYNNIMRTDISKMGVGCWFCSTSQGNYTYWVVTFG